MFGYVRPLKPELKVKEFETYNAIYCGLCHQLGKSFGAAARFTLSYDFAFLAMLYMATDKRCPSFKRCSCFANPLKKKMCCTSEEALSFSADAAAISLYFKVRDNIEDGRWWEKPLWSILLPFAAVSRKKAAIRCPEMDAVFAEMITRQHEAEKRGAEADEAAEPTAKAMAAVFTMLPAESGAQKRVLERLGYLIGRYIYLCDACDDLEEDRKKGRFNPLIQKGETPDSKEIEGAVYLTIAEIQAAYALLEVDRYGEILENIVMLGLKSRADAILQKRTAETTASEDPVLS
ncbi:MAG: hypothetical protein E7487_02735 [Ruminococcaceae bacterium]|nr:hypothetical protein [Oscillospiraceae bacterium]